MTEPTLSDAERKLEEIRFLAQNAQQDISTYIACLPPDVAARFRALVQGCIASGRKS